MHFCEQRNEKQLFLCNTYLIFRGFSAMEETIAGKPAYFSHCKGGHSITLGGHSVTQQFYYFSTISLCFRYFRICPNNINRQTMSLRAHLRTKEGPAFSGKERTRLTKKLPPANSILSLRAKLQALHFLLFSLHSTNVFSLLLLSRV